MLSEEEYAKLKKAYEAAKARELRECRIAFEGMPPDCLDDPAKEREWDRKKKAEQKKQYEEFDRFINGPLVWSYRETN
ncbi:MAG: hypothetical protein JNK76_01785 [Planctomycetales bacterium]|nr:hypothetical protein [Planctomycetales bacterium]